MLYLLFEPLMVYAWVLDCLQDETYWDMKAKPPEFLNVERLIVTLRECYNYWWHEEIFMSLYHRAVHLFRLLATDEVAENFVEEDTGLCYAGDQSVFDYLERSVERIIWRSKGFCQHRELVIDPDDLAKLILQFIPAYQPTLF